MAAFRQAFENMPSSSSAPSLSIRGSANGPPTRGVASALRSAGMSTRGARDADGMDLDGGAGRPARPKHVRSRESNPLSQAGRPKPRGSPYGKAPTDRAIPTQPRRNSDTGPRPTLASRMGGSSSSSIGRGGKPITRPHRAPAGTPDLLKVRNKAEEAAARSRQAGKVSEKFKTEEFKNWLRGRLRAPGVMDMGNLVNDAWLKQAGIEHLASSTAATNAGSLMWKLIQVNVEDATKVPIHTLSLASNGFTDLRQLSRISYSLNHIRALDLSQNPIRDVGELDNLLAKGEQKGKAVTGVGSLKGLTELLLVGCRFREEMLRQPGGDEKYQHEILRRFPGLLILDGRNLNRVVFAVPRQPKLTLTDADKTALAARPYTYPVEVQPKFMDNEAIEGVIMAFLAKFFPLYDSDRRALIPAYNPTATLSISANPTTSTSAIAKDVETTRHSRPRTAPFTVYVDLPGRNFFKYASSIERRVSTLKSPANPADLVAWWDKIPATVHPLTDPKLWAFDAWVLDEYEGGATACVTIQGEFQEAVSKSFRSFSRTFILETVKEGSAAQQAGWPCEILSDTLIVHPYFSNAAFSGASPLAQAGVSISPPDIPVSVPVAAPSTTGAPTGQIDQAAQSALIDRVRAATGMNQQFAMLCLEQNGWNFEVALANFAQIKDSIPADAFQ